MKIIKPYFDVYEDLTDPVVTGQMLMKLDEIGRTCYKSEASDDTVAAGKFVRKLIEHGHEAMLEHVSISVKFVVDRGVSHELVRHRMASFAQESTRYCNYSKDKFGNEVTFIKPCFLEEDDVPSSDWDIWKSVMQKCEEAYLELVDSSRTPQEARDVLPNSLKTEVVMTANIREWRAFFRLRAACETGMPHPQMLEVSIPLFQKFVYLLPELFFDIEIPDEVMLKYGFAQKD